MDRSGQLKSNADRILYGFNLFDYLHTIGKAHIVGSYKMNIMAVADLDIYVESDRMDLSKLYKLTDHVLKTIQPKWYEGKEIVNNKGNKEWFFGFEKEIRGETFNVDIWFLDKNKIENTENFCDAIVQHLNPQKTLATLEIKQQLTQLGLYGSNYHSIDVYDAVINQGILTTQQFLENYKKGE